ncbi:hypothetical protein AND4_04268, partial [Vibrio sp. AND4]
MPPPLLLPPLPPLVKGLGTKFELLLGAEVVLIIVKGGGGLP